MLYSKYGDGVSIWTQCDIFRKDEGNIVKEFLLPNYTSLSKL